MMSIAALAAAAGEAAGAHDAAPGGIFADSAFFVLVAFAIVIFIFARAGVHRMIASGLDKRSQKIADELDEARRLREEAQELLATYQRRQRAAEEEAQGILAQAKKDAQRFAAESREKISAQIARRARAAEEKIARAEAQALAEVRGQAADLAVEIARSIIRERMDKGAQAALIDRAIADVGARLN